MILSSSWKWSLLVILSLNTIDVVSGFTEGYTTCPPAEKDYDLCTDIEVQCARDYDLDLCDADHFCPDTEDLDLCDPILHCPDDLDADICYPDGQKHQTDQKVAVQFKITGVKYEYMTDYQKGILQVEIQQSLSRVADVRMEYVDVHLEAGSIWCYCEITDPHVKPGTVQQRVLIGYLYLETFVVWTEHHIPDTPRLISADWYQPIQAKGVLRSSPMNPNGPIENIIDHDTSTFANFGGYGASFPVFVELDLGEVFSIGGIGIKPHVQAESPKDMSVERWSEQPGSLGWVRVTTLHIHHGAWYHLEHFELGGSYAFRYWKLLIMATYNNAAPTIQYIEFYPSAYQITVTDFEVLLKPVATDAPTLLPTQQPTLAPTKYPTGSLEQYTSKANLAAHFTISTMAVALALALAHDTSP